MGSGKSEAEDENCGYICNGFVICNRFNRFARPKIFLAALILLGLVHGIAETFFTETITSANFQNILPFRLTRWFILGSEVTQLLIALPFVYWGAIKHRPGWLAGSVAFLSVSAILLASQLLTEQSDSSQRGFTEYRTQKDPLLCNIWMDRYELRRWRLYWLTPILVSLLHFAIGISRIAFWAFGITFLDDHFSVRSSALVIGFALSVKQNGPFIGLFVSSLSTNTFRTGIYWLSVAALALVAALVTGMFPSRLLDKKGNLFTATTLQNGDSGYFPALKRVMSNRVIIFTCLAMVFLLAMVLNSTRIEDEYIESVFYVPVTNYSTFSSIFSLQYLFSILKPTVTGLSLISSGFIIYQIKPRASYLCMWSVVNICIATGCVFCLIFLRCSKTPIHREDSRNDLMEYCNKDCDCSEQLPFTPVCSPYDPFVYYSPCHAGCSVAFGSGDSRVYTNCTCVPTASLQGGHCSKGSCNIFYWLFQALILITSAAIANGFVGSLLVCFRSVLIRDKSIMTGLITVLSVFMATVPFKYLYNFITDYACIYFVGGQCRIYSSDITIYFHLLNIGFLILAAGMLAILCFLVQDLQLYDSQTPTKRKAETETATEMTDFRSQLNQALRARRESTAEEQQLLSEQRGSTGSRNVDSKNGSPVTESDKRQGSSHGYENGGRSSFTEDERPSPSTVAGRDSKPIVKKPPAVLPKPQMHTFQAKPLSTSETPPTSPHGTTIKREGFLTTLL